MGVRPFHFTMQLSLLLVTASLAFASANVTCDECKAAQAGLVDRLTSAASIEEQTGILIASICPQKPDPAMCEAVLTKSWGEIAGCLYPEFLGADDVCARLGLCSLLKDWTCEECTAIMAKLSEFIKDPATIAEGVTFLQGDCFCGQPGHDAEVCKEVVAELIPDSMKALGAVLVETTPELCQDVAGVC